jgi:hypothetical protein
MSQVQAQFSVPDGVLGPCLAAAILLVLSTGTSSCRVAYEGGVTEACDVVVVFVTICVRACIERAAPEGLEQPEGVSVTSCIAYSTRVPGPCCVKARQWHRDEAHR